jgi:hypothetical protein
MPALPLQSVKFMQERGALCGSSQGGFKDDTRLVDGRKARSARRAAAPALAPYPREGRHP